MNEEVRMNDLLLHGPLYLAQAKCRCWSCQQEITTVAIIATDLEEFEDRESMERFETEAYVYEIGAEDMPAELAQVLQIAAPSYRPKYSRTMSETLWANVCEHCGSLQGGFFLHGEPDGPFFGGPGRFKGTRTDLFPRSLLVQSASYAL